jgi:hypothetical protein
LDHSEEYFKGKLLKNLTDSSGISLCGLSLE